MQGGGVSDLAVGRPTSKQPEHTPPDHHLTHLSPATHKHINLYGRYDFTNPTPPPHGQLRPLRIPPETVTLCPFTTVTPSPTFSPPTAAASGRSVPLRLTPAGSGQQQRGRGTQTATKPAKGRGIDP